MMNEKKQTAIEVFENELRDRLCRQNDDDTLFSDLTGLFVDIIREVSKTDRGKSAVIYDYAILLEQDLQLYSGTEAYIMGRGAKDKPEKEVLNNYMCKVTGKSNEQRLQSRIQALFDEISRLLGDKNGLITEFTETYRSVHGIIASNIREFIRLGQTSGEDMTVSIPLDTPNQNISESLKKMIADMWPETQKIVFEKKDALSEFINTDSKDLYKYHFGLGMYLRNNVLKPDSELFLKFTENGILQRDDMSSAMIRIWHKFLHEEKIQ